MNKGYSVFLRVANLRGLEKAITFPTDAKLHHRLRIKLVGGCEGIRGEASSVVHAQTEAGVGDAKPLQSYAADETCTQGSEKVKDVSGPCGQRC